LARVITLKDVAREAGVHVSTASRALNPGTRSVVNDETAGRVLAVAERLGYRPHPLARGLRTNQTLTIGMIVPDLMNPLFPPIYAGAEASLREMGYSLLIGNDDDDPVKARAVMAALLERRVDGLILATAHLDFAMPAALNQELVPTVLVNRTTDSMALPAIIGDDDAGIGLVVRHLVGHGHTAIAHVTGPTAVSTGRTRNQAFVRWMESEGLAADPALIVEAEAFRTEAGHLACDRLLDAGPPFTAIVAGNDLIALGCYDALAARGLSIPERVSITGYNDMTFIDRVNPPLTTVSLPYKEMGAAAAQALLSMLEFDDWRAGAIDTLTTLQPSLVVRESTGPAPVL
jgi:LacI family transcriptional regulator